MWTTWEEELWKDHTKELEQEVMNKHEIIVATVGTSADGRVRSRNSPRKISTVIIDEAAHDIDKPDMLFHSVHFARQTNEY